MLYWTRLSHDTIKLFRPPPLRGLLYRQGRFRCLPKGRIRDPVPSVLTLDMEGFMAINSMGGMRRVIDSQVRLLDHCRARSVMSKLPLLSTHSCHSKLRCSTLAGTTCSTSSRATCRCNSLPGGRIADGLSRVWGGVHVHVLAARLRRWRYGWDTRSPRCLHCRKDPWSG